MNEKNKTKGGYDSAMTELKEIVSALQSEDVGIDDLTAHVKRASALLEQCKQQLTKTASEVELALDQFNLTRDDEA